MERLTTLYISRPRHLYCFDECPGIQVLQRLAPGVAPVDKDAGIWLEEFEYIRHGTLDVLAFLNVNTGKTTVECCPDKKST